jgi:putative pantetheine hydrolase
MGWLAEHGAGYRVGAAAHEVVPVVPAAAIFDLGRGGEFGARPGPADGFAAVVAAAATEPGAALTQGCVGAGTGAVAGGLKGGVGTASAVLDTAAGPVTVGALVVANAFGSAVDPRDGRLLGARHGLAGEFDDAGRQAGGPMRADGTADGPAGPSSTGPTAPLNTTIGVVATDAVLDRAEAAKIAGLSHDGLARALHPVHTLFDGDTLYALSTGRVALPDADATGYPDRAAHALLLTMIGTAAADCVTRAVCHALLAAETTRTEVGAWTGYRDTAPPA